MSIRARRNNGFQNVDLQTLSYYIGLVIIGWMMIIAATAKGNDFGGLSSEATKQGFFILISFVLIVGISFIEWKFWRTFSYVFYALSIFSLIAVLIIGKKVSGATSWFSIGGFSLQPSEFAKFATCLAMASFLSSYNANLKIFKSQLIAFGLITIPIILILLQPDAGSAIVFTSFLILFYRLGLSENFYIVFLTLTTLFIIALIYDPYYVILGFMMTGTGIFIYNLKNEKRIWIIGFTLMIIGTIAGLYFFPLFYQEIFVFNLWKTLKEQIFVLDLFKEGLFTLNVVPFMFITSSILSLVTIFLYKNRKLQFVIGRIIILMNLFLLGLLIYLSLTLSGETIVSEKGIGMFLPILVVLLIVLANKAIKKDEDLVKSVDRLR